MNLLDIIDDELIEDGFDTDLLDDKIIWKDGFGAENEILKSNIAYSGQDIAWWQMSEVGKDLLRIKKANGLIISWRPKSNHSDWGFGCDFLKWFDQQLVVMYSDKHHQRIYRFEGIQVKELFVGRIADYTIQGTIINIQPPEWSDEKALSFDLLS